MQPFQPHPSLTAVVVANGSIEALQRSLATASAVAKEVLIAPTALTPDRDQLQLSAGVRFVDSAELDHRGQVRNAALAQASGSWILWLQAGEVFDAEAQEALVEFIQEDSDPNCAYWMFIALPAEHGNIAGEQFAEMRLHPAKQELFYAGRLRETILPSVEQCGLKVEGLALTVRRLAEGSPAFERRTAIQQDKVLAERALAECGPSPEILNCLGEATQKLGEWEASEQFYRRGLAAAERKSPAALESYYGLLATLDARGANRQQLLRLCMEAIEMFPLDAQLLCALGGYLQSLNHLELAARSYDVAVQHGRVEPTIPHLANILELAAASQADVHFQAEQWSAADKAVSAGLEFFPESQRLLRQQLQLAVRRRDDAAALAIAAKIEVKPELRDTLTAAVHGALAATDGSLMLARAQLESAWRAGLHDPLCCLWLAEVQLAQEAWADAQVTLDAWHQLQPRSAELRRLRERWTKSARRTEAPVAKDFEYEIVAPPAATSTTNLRIDPPATKTSPPLAPLAQKLAAARRK